VLGHYVREKKILTTEDAIRKMTSFPATKYGLKDRGLLKEGMVADIVVFDPDVITETGTIDYPNRYPTGIEYVLVNGKLVVDQGTYTGDMNGALIRRESP
jgi:N-acyl-D-amino-acid deacylase